MQYLFQTILYQLVFLLVYEYVLKRETFFKYNRLYLLLTSGLSLLIPLVKIPVFATLVPEQFVVNLPSVAIGDTSATDSSFSVVNTVTHFNLVYLLYIGMAIALLLFAIRLFKVVSILKRKSISINNIKLISLKNSKEAFSFLNYICVGDLIPKTQAETIVTHETFHVKSKHTIDVLYFQVLRVVFWFNPLLYVYQKRITEIHEYQADAYVLQNTTKTEYYKQLLQQVFQVEHLPLINSFYKQSLIKKRIIMLQKSKSKNSLKLKYVLLMPVVFAMLVYSSCSQETESNAEAKQIEDKPITAIGIEEKKSDYEEVEYEYVVGDVPFAVIEEPPVFPGCESLPKDQQKKCFIQKISQYVAENFNTKLADNLNLKGRQRIITKFKIDSNGNVVDVKVRAPHPELEAEAKRVVSSLPQVTPGMQRGKAVSVPYSLPIVFQINP